MACSTGNAFDIVCRLDRVGKLVEAPQNQKQELATGLLLDKLYEKDFAGLNSLQASKVLGPITRYRVADILHHMKLVSRPSRPGLTDGVRRILCNGLCAAQRFHTEVNEQMCRVGCPNEPDSLITTNALRLYDMFVSIWGHVAVFPRRNHLLHDLITQVFLRSLQCGIVVMGFIDTFVYAYHQHRRSIEHPEFFGDCMKGRIRFMTAITPAYAHAHQATCLSRSMPAIMGEISVCRSPTPDIRIFPMLVPQHVKQAITIVGGVYLQIVVFEL